MTLDHVEGAVVALVVAFVWVLLKLGAGDQEGGDEQE